MGITVNGNCYVYGSYIESVTNYYESGDKSRKDVPANHKEATDALLAYVEKVHPMATAQWAEKYTCLWEALVGIPGLQLLLLTPGRQKDVCFNRNLVANILHQLNELNVIVQNSATEVAVCLENNANHSVRAALGMMPPSDVCEVVQEMVKKMI